MTAKNFRHYGLIYIKFLAFVRVKVCKLIEFMGFSRVIAYILRGNDNNFR